MLSLKDDIYGYYDFEGKKLISGLRKLMESLFYYVCPGNEPGTGGLDIVISLLEGFISPPPEAPISTQHCFECIVDDYFSFVCQAYISNTMINRCD